LGAQFTEIFVKDSANVSLLLSILEETDFHVRYNAIDLLKALLKNKSKQLQDCILTSPMGVSRLMDLLEDQREVIRNGTFCFHWPRLGRQFGNLAPQESHIRFSRGSLVAD
jgi:uncharacterized SAM-dependent methyltransferase